MAAPTRCCCTLIVLFWTFIFVKSVSNAENKINSVFDTCFEKTQSVQICQNELEQHSKFLKIEVQQVFELLKRWEACEIKSNYSDQSKIELQEAFVKLRKQNKTTAIEIQKVKEKLKKQTKVNIALNEVIKTLENEQHYMQKLYCFCIFGFLMFCFFVTWKWKKKNLDKLRKLNKTTSIEIQKVKEELKKQTKKHDEIKKVNIALNKVIKTLDNDFLSNDDGGFDDDYVGNPDPSPAPSPAPFPPAPSPPAPVPPAPNSPALPRRSRRKRTISVGNRSGNAVGSNSRSRSRAKPRSRKKKKTPKPKKKPSNNRKTRKRSRSRGQGLEEIDSEPDSSDSDDESDAINTAYKMISETVLPFKSYGQKSVAWYRYRIRRASNLWTANDTNQMNARQLAETLQFNYLNAAGRGVSVYLVGAYNTACYFQDYKQKKGLFRDDLTIDALRKDGFKGTINKTAISHYQNLKAIVDEAEVVKFLFCCTATWREIRALLPGGVLKAAFVKFKKDRGEDFKMYLYGSVPEDDY